MDTEKALLGSLLWNGEKIEEAVDEITPEMFDNKVNEVIYSTMLSLFNKGLKIDSLTLINEIIKKKKGLKDTIKEYVSEIVEQSPSTALIDNYVGIIKENYVRKSLKNNLI